MYQKILVPLDGSELSECSLAHARAVAIGCHVPDLVLLRVVEPLSAVIATGDTEGYIPPGDWQEGLRVEAEGYIAKVAATLKKEGIAARGAVVSGRAADEIIDYAGKNQVDLIIMSTHGRAGVSRWVLGSVADRVVRHSPVPVLVVPPHGSRVVSREVGG